LPKDVLAVVLPPSPLLHAAQALTNQGWVIGAQACHAKSSGAFTGMVAADHLAEVGAKYVLIGHSERRVFEGEAFLQAAYLAAEAAMLQPILCIGETWEQRSEVQTILQQQLAYLALSKSEELWVAYEPRWAIGSGKTPELAELSELFTWLRAEISRISPRHVGKIRLLYGGSLGPANVKQFMAASDIDGGLIGGASLKIDQMRDMLLC